MGWKMVILQSELNYYSTGSLLVFITQLKGASIMMDINHNYIWLLISPITLQDCGKHVNILYVSFSREKSFLEPSIHGITDMFPVFVFFVCLFFSPKDKIASDDNIRTQEITNACWGHKCDFQRLWWPWKKSKTKWKANKTKMFQPEASCLMCSMSPFLRDTLVYVTLYLINEGLLTTGKTFAYRWLRCRVFSASVASSVPAG